MFTVNNKKQPPVVFYKKDADKNFSRFTGEYLPAFESLFNQVAGLQLCNSILDKRDPVPRTPSGRILRPETQDSKLSRWDPGPGTPKMAAETQDSKIFI